VAERQAVPIESESAEPQEGTSREDQPAEDKAGIIGSLSRVGAALSEAFDTRATLAALELGEQTRRIEQRVVLLLILAIGAGFALLALQALMVAMLWDRMGGQSLAVLAGLWILVCLVVGWKLSLLAQRSDRPFGATIDTLRRDRALLAATFRLRKP
jgi:uncharacterized membrane protein YqjE